VAGCKGIGIGRDRRGGGENGRGARRIEGDQGGMERSKKEWKASKTEWKRCRKAVEKQDGGKGEIGNYRIRKELTRSRKNGSKKWKRNRINDREVRINKRAASRREDEQAAAEVEEKHGGDDEKGMEDELDGCYYRKLFFEKNTLKERLEGRLFQKKSWTLFTFICNVIQSYHK
jgi:hypothetical protein